MTKIDKEITPNENLGKTNPSVQINSYRDHHKVAKEARETKSYGDYRKMVKDYNLTEFKLETADPDVIEQLTPETSIFFDEPETSVFFDHHDYSYNNDNYEPNFPDTSSQTDPNHIIDDFYNTGYGQDYNSEQPEFTTESDNLLKELALYGAIKSSDLDLVQALVMSNADLNQRNNNGDTPLLWTLKKLNNPAEQINPEIPTFLISQMSPEALNAVNHEGLKASDFLLGTESIDG
ncbi:MAG: hypothetical protein DGJ47_000774 [Rickettsiaceae bacterium]